MMIEIRTMRINGKKIVKVHIKVKDQLNKKMIKERN